MNLKLFVFKWHSFFEINSFKFKSRHLSFPLVKSSSFARSLNIHEQNYFLQCFSHSFITRDDKPYCADCFGELFSKRCTACTKPITGHFCNKSSQWIFKLNFSSKYISKKETILKKCMLNNMISTTNNTNHNI